MDGLEALRLRTYAMLPLDIKPHRGPLRVTCIGAHSDDIEIGCGGTLLRWLAEHEQVEVTWCVLSAGGERAVEARRSAEALLRQAARHEVIVGEFDDACLPADYRKAKDFLTAVRARTAADVVLTHSLDDRHQDHRLVAELTWQHWRDHLVLEYEVPKYEGDLPRPNLLIPLPQGLAERKVRHLIEHFGSQRSKDWFSEETFLGLMRLRGVESRAASGYAEGFVARKVVL